VEIEGTVEGNDVARDVLVEGNLEGPLEVR